MIQVQNETIQGSSAQMESMRALLNTKETQLALLERDQELQKARIASLESEVTKYLQQPVQTKTMIRRRRNTSI